MTECQVVRRLLAEAGLEDLPPSVQVSIADHLAECPECDAAQERSVLMDFAMAAGLEEAVLAKRDKLRLGNGFALRGMRSFRLAAIALAASLALAGAGWFAAPIIEGWRFPGADATPVRPEYELLGIPLNAAEGATVTRDQIGPWRIEQDLVPGFASLDARVSRSGGTSIKLVQRSGSGKLRQNVPIPLPPGTRITFGAWVLAPRGGTGDNKYFSMEIWPNTQGKTATTDSGGAVSYLFDPSPNWHPIILRSELESAAESFSVVMSVSNGDGNYYSNDWATWVDDIFVAVVVPLSATFEVSGDKVVVEATLPQGYDATMVDPGSIKFYAYDPADGRDIAGKALPSPTPNSIRLEIDSPAAVAAMHHRNKDNQGPPTARINGRFNFGAYSVPFEVGLVGGVNGPDLATQPLP